MRRLAVLSSLAFGWVVLVVGCSTQQAAAPPPVDNAAIGSAVDSVNQAYLAAVTARDTDAIVALYSEDANLMPSNMARMTGHDAIRKGWAGFLQTPDLDFKFSSTDKTVAKAGDMVIDLGTYDISGKDAKGKPFHDTGKYVTVLKKTDAGWKVFVDTFNSDQPMPGM